MIVYVEIYTRNVYMYTRNVYKTLKNYPKTEVNSVYINQLHFCTLVIGMWKPKLKNTKAIIIAQKIKSLHINITKIYGTCKLKTTKC